jgi:outer membrane immunogenic protein
MVLGLEGDLNWTSARATDAFALCCSSNRIGSEAHSKFDAFASIRGRMGMAFDNALIYVTGGPVWGHFNSGVSNLDLPFTNNASTDDGWHPGEQLDLAWRVSFFEFSTYRSTFGRLSRGPNVRGRQLPG